MELGESIGILERIYPKANYLIAKNNPSYQAYQKSYIRVS